jgi:hypothetical protein|tara:strand:- start:967 stop:1344 length:378 start_codon:yes stop_codon:yes gene_type:complete
MHIEKVFKNLIISQFALLLVLVIYSIFSPVDDAFVEEDIIFSSVEIALLIVLAVSYANYFLLFTFKSIGKVLFIPILLVLYTLVFLMPVDSSSNDAITELFDYLSITIDGMLIAMLYFSDIKNKF